MTTEKKRIQKRAWRLANRDKVLAQKERYRQKHPERIKAAQKKHYESNKPKRLAKARKHDKLPNEFIKEAA